jgi:hypothetical protein
MNAYHTWVIYSNVYLNNWGSAIRISVFQLSCEATSWLWGPTFSLLTYMIDILTVQFEVLWVVTSCSDVVRYERFGGPCCLHLQGELIDCSLVFFRSDKIIVSHISPVFHETRIKVCKNIILPVSLYGYEARSLTLKHHTFYIVYLKHVLSFVTCTIHQILLRWSSRGWGGRVMGEMKNVYKILIGEPERRKQLGSCRRRWEGNNRMSLRVIGCVILDWIHLAQYNDQWRALVNRIMNLRVP